MEKLVALLEALRADEYVRFKYGKQLDAALKALDARREIDPIALERQLEALLDWTRAQQGGGPSQAAPKRRAPATRKKSGEPTGG